MANTGKSNSGNFANDPKPKKAADAGKKGGQASGGSNMSGDKTKASDTQSDKKGGSTTKGGAGGKS